MSAERRTHRLAMAIAAVGMLVATFATAAEERRDAGIRVSVVQAARSCFTGTIHVTGYVVPTADAIVSFDLDNYQVAEVLAREGDRVNANQPLARLTRISDPTSREALQLPGSITLRSPTAGRIVGSRATIGATASPKGEPLFRLAGEDRFEVDAEVPSIYLGQLKENDRARVETSAGRIVQGSVRRIASQIDAVRQMVHVRILVDRDPSLHAGALARASIDSSQSCGVSVPRSAVLFGSEGPSVQVVRGRIVMQQRVRVGLLSERDVEVRAGLAIGDLVVAHAGTSLRDGDVVTPDTSGDSERRPN